MVSEGRQQCWAQDEMVLYCKCAADMYFTWCVPSVLELEKFP